MTDPVALARAVSEAMHANDEATRLLGIDILESIPGEARLRMTVQKAFTNGHDICHGGLIFTLADSTFAHACNNRNRSTVAAGASIEFVAAARTGDVLTAIGRERHRRGRTGVYDVEVTNQHGELVALFRGKSHELRGRQVIDGESS